MASVTASAAPVTLDIAGLAAGGEGVGRVGGQVLFVPGALPGETVVVAVEERHPTFARARLIGVLSASADRVIPPCPVVHACGGCPLQSLAPVAQRREKARRLADQLRHLGGIAQPAVPQVRSPGPDYGYRAKASLVAGRGPDGRLALGFYGPHSHRLVPAAGCLVAAEPVRDAAAAVERALRALDLPPYDEDTDRGFVRHVVLRRATGTGELMVLLVTRTVHWPGVGGLAGALRDRLGQAVTCLAQSVNPARGNRVLGKSARVLDGAQAIWEEVCGLRVRLSPTAFFQVNPVVADAVYRHVAAELAVREGHVVLDAHAGVGAMALMAAREGARGVGFETVGAAVLDARASARENGLEGRVRFAQGEAERLYPLDFADRAPDRVVLDPPRAGCSKELLQALRRRPPERLVYVSCDGATLARDLKTLLSDGRFVLTRTVAFDMFPHTAHLEAVATLRRGPEAARRRG